MSKKAKKCKHCDREAKTRGVCIACYNAARTKILNGEYTDDELVEMGLLDPLSEKRNALVQKLMQEESDE